MCWRSWSFPHGGHLLRTAITELDPGPGVLVSVHCGHLSRIAEAEMDENNGVLRYSVQ